MARSDGATRRPRPLRVRRPGGPSSATLGGPVCLLWRLAAGVSAVLPLVDVRAYMTCLQAAELRLSQAEAVQEGAIRAGVDNVDRTLGDVELENAMLA